MTDETQPRAAWSRLPPWARIGLIAVLAIVVVLATVVVVRALSRVPAIPFGTTAVGDLQVGSCLRESDSTLETFTVTACTIPHAQQVFAAAELDFDENVYALAAGALSSFADAVCDRYLEYRLFLVSDLETGDYSALAIAVPTPEQYADGDTEALCVIVAEDGSELNSDLYRALP